MLFRSMSKVMITGRKVTLIVTKLTNKGKPTGFLESKKQDMVGLIITNLPLANTNLWVVVSYDRIY